jgi:hypothetical protein
MSDQPNHNIMNENTRFEVGKFYSYKKFIVGEYGCRRGFEKMYYQCIKRTKSYIHFENAWSIVKKKPKLDTRNNEYVYINNIRLDSEKFDHDMNKIDLISKDMIILLEERGIL